MKGAFSMGRKGKVPVENKLDAVNAYLTGVKGINQICSELQIYNTSFYKWLAKYQSQGADSLKYSPRNTYYPKEMKIAAVKEYLSGNISMVDIVKKYKISTKSILETWIKKYNGHETMKSQNSTGGKIMTNGRKTTYEERIEIVSFCIANNENYQLTSEKFQISYQQAYTWTKKYKMNGLDALVDNRGKRKKTDDMSETEKLSAQLKLLEAENKRLQLEVGFLKKLEEVERRRTGKTNILPLKNTVKKPNSQ
jgi:transposase-like protein